MWRVEDRLTHRFNPELGPGRVVAVEDRAIVVEFPRAGTTLRLAARTDALIRWSPRAGLRARLGPGGREALVAEVEAGDARLEDGATVPLAELWPPDVAASPIEALAHGDAGPVEAFALRLDALHLLALREAEGLGSFLGGRIRLFPHQLYVAERATGADPVRWLLADEVGLGKTVEACLILNHLIHRRGVARALVVAPESLTVQWLGELWRKYHQVFVLLDDKRLADVERDFGPDFSPFDVHRRAVVALETLQARPRLAELAASAAVDVLIVDEAHRLRRPPGHPGEPAYRAVAPVVAASRHVLLLTATPLDDDVHGFFRLLQLLHPETFPDEAEFQARLARREALPPCTSSTRRADIGGLPPRVGVPVEVDDDEGWGAAAALEAAVRALPAPNAAARKEKARKIRLALTSGASVLGALHGKEHERHRALARRALEADPRLRWLCARATAWKRLGEKVLVFTADRESLEAARTELSRRAQIATAVFHEDLSTAQRDLEVAQFRAPGGPSILLSTEAGGEGRNFEFCRRLVLLDLPWNPLKIEQRVGRLDRIGRRLPVEVMYFRPPGGIGAAVARLAERLGVFREPLASLEGDLAHVDGLVEEAALAGTAPIPPDAFDDAADAAREARDRARAGAYHELHRDPYRPDMAPSILARIPEDLESLTEDVVLGACDVLGFHVEEHRGPSTYSIEFGSRARVDSLPGVPPGSGWVGTFDREAAVEDEALDFFASGHALVEGLLAALEDGPWGRAAALHVDGRGRAGFGLVALYKAPHGFDVAAVDAEGNDRPDWAATFRARPLRVRRVRSDAWIQHPGWAETVRRLGAILERRGRPEAVAALFVGL